MIKNYFTKNTRLSIYYITKNVFRIGLFLSLLFQVWFVCTMYKYSVNGVIVSGYELFNDLIVSNELSIFCTNIKGCNCPDNNKSKAEKCTESY